MLKRKRKPDSTKEQEWQPRLYAILIGLALIVAYVIAFIVENSNKVSVHWVFGTTHTSVIWVLIVSLAIGILVGVLLSQLYRRRWRRRHRPTEKAPEHGGQPPDTVRDLGH